MSFLFTHTQFHRIILLMFARHDANVITYRIRFVQPILMLIPVTVNYKTKCILNSGNAFCHSVQNLSYSHVLFKIMKIKIHEIYHLTCFYMGVKLDLLH
jgi:hypothetical protein